MATSERLLATGFGHAAVAKVATYATSEIQHNCDSGVSAHVQIADIGPRGHIDSMGTKRGGMTLREAMEQQEADPAYQAMRRARDGELAKVAEQHRLEEQPLLNDLSAAGVIVASVVDLCSIPDPDPRIYPVLLDHLTKPNPPWLNEWIGRAFGRKTARPLVWHTLINLIKTHALEERATEGVMTAVSIMAQPRDLETLVDLLSDPFIGGSRIFLVSNLMRSKRPAARAALLQHQDDPDLTIEIKARLARSRS